MKIAVFASAFHPSIGGVEEVVRQTSHVLLARGHEVMVLANRWPRDLPIHDNYEGIPIFRSAMRNRGEQLKSRITYALFSRAERRRVNEELRAWGAEIVHLHCVGPNTAYALDTVETLHLPLVLSMHGELSMDADGIFERDADLRDQFREAVRQAQVVTGVSRQVLEEAEAFLGTHFGSRGRVILNGLTLSEFENVPAHVHSRPYVLAIGRHVPQKGFDVLLRAMARWHKEDANAPDLILAGDGSEHEKLKRLASELKLDGIAHFPGRADRRAVAALFLGCEMFVLPSRHEPLGIVNLEAMAAGKALIASRVGGVPEIVRDGEQGILVPPEDENALAGAMARLWNNPQERARMGAAGRAFAQTRDWSQVALEYERACEDALRLAVSSAPPQTTLAEAGVKR